MKYNFKKGFTLIELLIVIAIIAILAAVIFVALDPLTRFRDSRDAARYTDVESIAHAIELDQVDNGGEYLSVVQDMVTGTFYMIVDGNGGSAMTNGCDDNNTSCDVNVDSDGYCVDLDDLVDQGYLGDVPVSPAGVITWDDGSLVGEEGSGYVVKREDNGTIYVQACESENVTDIFVVR
ncbi:hypothetical protein C0581_02545 [Candidatus Parcubacteria bacterium]|nr:MAG: hypothetical protein C0581_02545 [Candidatus Parcubacteria bacterium]